jgi:ParB family chromosome partitioning protein
VRKTLEDNLISEGHARALLPLGEKDATIILKSVIDRSLSVRETERLVKNSLKPAKKETDGSSVDNEAFKRELEEFAGLKVNIRTTAKGGGIIEFKYSNIEELDVFVQKIRGS